MDHSGRRESVALLQSVEVGPGEWSRPTSAGEPPAPDPPGALQKILEAGEVPRDPVVTVVALQFLLECPVLIFDRQVQVLPAPRRQRLKRSLDSFTRGVAMKGFRVRVSSSLLAIA